MAFKPGIVSSTIRPPSVTITNFSNPAVNETNYPNLYTASSSVTRYIDYQVSIGSESELNGSYTAKLVAISGNTATLTDQTYTVTATGSQTARTFTSLTPSATYRLDITFTDRYGTVKTVSSSNITTPAATNAYVNVANKSYVMPDSQYAAETYYGNLNDYDSEKTSGTSIGAGSAFDNDSTTSWQISSLGASDYGGVYCSMQFTENDLATLLGKSIVSSTANAVGLVDDTMNAWPYAVRYRLSARKDTYLFYYDMGSSTFKSRVGATKRGTLGNINLNAYDNQYYQSRANNDSIDQPYNNGVGWNYFTDAECSGFTMINYLGLTLLKLRLRLLQGPGGTASLTDVQLKIACTYTERELRYR